MARLSAEDVWFQIGDAYYKLTDQFSQFIGFGTAAGKFLYTTGVKTWAEADITSFGRTFVAYADAATAFTNIKQAATTSATGVVEEATDAEVRSATDGKFLDAAHIETASALVAISDAATVAVDWDAGINFSLTITADRAIGNPSNGQPGTWRTILVQGNNTTDRALTFSSNFGGEVPELTDIDDTKWYLISIFCVTTSHFIASAIDGSPP